MEKWVNLVKNIIANTPDTTDQYDPQDIKDNKWMGILSYINLLCLIPIIMDKFLGRKSKFGMYHANQGFVHAIVWYIGRFVFKILGKIWLIGWFFRIARVLLTVTLILLSGVGIMNAAGGRAKELPFVGKIRLFK